MLGNYLKMQNSKPQNGSLGKPTLSALFISLDKNLLLPKAGNSLSRHRRYAANFRHLYIIVLTTKRDGITREVHEKNLTIIPTDSGSRWGYIVDALRLATKFSFRDNINIVSAQDPFICAAVALFLKAKWNVPVNIQVHNDYFQSKAWRRESIENMIWFYLGKLTLRRADSIRVVSQRIKRSIRGFVNPEVPVDQIIVSPSIVFHQATKKDKDIHVVSIGRLVKQKDFPTLIKAVAHLKSQFPNLNVHIIGEGPDFTELKAMTHKLGLSKNIYFQGKCPQSKVIDLLSRSQIYVSSSKYEGSSIALLEALLMGLPVVATKVSGTEDIIDSGKNGFLIQPGSDKSLAKYVKTLLMDTKLQNDLENKANKTALEIIENNSEERWIELLKKTKSENKSLTMKQTNIAKYNTAFLEIEKSKKNASKIVYYPRLVKWLQKYIKSREKIVDIGGGAGVIMVRLKRTLIDLNVLGLDISLLMAKLRKKQGLTANIVGDMDRLPIHSNSVDASVFIASLHHTINTDKAISESFRILNPGGVLLLIEPNSFRCLFYPWKQGAIPITDDPRECLINHRIVTHQLAEQGFIIEECSIQRQFVAIAELLYKKIPLPVYKILTLIDEIASKLPGIREIGSLMLIAARKPYE